MFKRDDWSNQSRTAGASGLISMGLALALSVASVTVAAQTVFEFEDPLEDVRAKIERQAADAEKAAAAAAETPSVTEAATDWAASATRAADGAVDGATAGIKAQATSLAERLGLPTGGLLGIGVLAALALGLGLFWLLARRRPAKASGKRKDRDLYAVTNGSRARRVLDSGARVTRNRTQSLDTEEVATAGVAATAAKILNDEALTEDELERAYDATPSADRAPAEAEPAPAEIKADDPDTWRRPNLDRLKASIREDWKQTDSPKADPAPTPLQSEAKAFAELFGDDDAPVTTRAETKSPVLDMLDTFEGTKQDDMPISALQSAVSAHVNKTGQSLARPERPSRSDAVRRIKALRDSVKAG